MFAENLQRRTRPSPPIASFPEHLNVTILPSPTSMERSTRPPFVRSMFPRAFASRTTRSIAILAVLAFLLLFSLTGGSSRLRSVPFGRTPLDAKTILPAHLVPEPLYYEDEPSPSDWKYRENAVKNAFLHAYRAYEANAFPADELLPLSNKPRQNFNSWGVSVVDAMDTMLLMGLKLEYERAVVHVSTMKFNLLAGEHVHFFETTIRYLGGLLSAYALSKDPILLKKADELGHKLLPVFETRSGLPTYGVNTQSGKGFSGPNPPRVLLAEMASCQLEYRYLAHLTGREEYYWAVNRVNNVLQVAQNLRNDSLWATHWETENGTQTNDHMSVGAWADSAYEYILKQYLQTSRSEPRFKRMYVRATRGILDTLLYLSPTRNLIYVTDTYGGIPTRKFEHLSCFYPGLLALGAHALINDTTFSTRDAEQHRWAAEGLAHTCWTLYGESPTGLAPEEAQFKPRFLTGVPKTKTYEERWMSGLWAWEAQGKPGGKPPGVAELAGLVMNTTGVPRDYETRTAPYYLRPETIESIYLMWKTTGNDVWRERGWSIFRAIEKHCRLHSGYASISSVDFADPHVIRNKLDDMPSYALAETWKYLYLMFTDKDPIPLDKWVFNTEAHPLPIFEWNEKERKKYGIQP